MELLDLPIADIEIPSVRVTSHFPAELLEQFRLSVQTVGVVQPLQVLRDNGHFLLVDGLHRLQEAQARGDTKIPCVIANGSMRDALLQNLLTSGVRGRPKASEMRKVIGALGDEYGMDSIAIRKSTGLSQDYVERLMWVNRAHPYVQRALDEEEISVSHAAAIARIERHDVQERVLDACLTNRMNVDGLRHHIALVEEILANPAAADPTPAPLAPRLARCYGCRHDLPPEDLTMYSLCPSCHSALWASIRTPPQS